MQLIIQHSMKKLEMFCLPVQKIVLAFVFLKSLVRGSRTDFV